MAFYDPDCPFNILVLEQTATEQEVVQKWKELMLMFHPDKCTHADADAIAQRLNDAKERAVQLCRERSNAQHVLLDVNDYIASFRSTLCNFMTGKYSEHVAELTSRFGALIRGINEKQCYQAKLFPHWEMVVLFFVFQDFRNDAEHRKRAFDEQALRLSNLQCRLDAEIAAKQQLQEQLSRGKESEGLCKQVAEREAELRGEFAQRESAMQEEFAKREAAIREEFTKLQAAMQEESTKSQAAMQAVHERLAAWHSEFDAGLCLADACAERLSSTLAQLADAQAAHVNAAQQQIAQLQGKIADLQEKEQQDSQHTGHNIDTDQEPQRRRKHRKTFPNEDAGKKFKDSVRMFIENNLKPSDDGKGFIPTRKMKTMFDATMSNETEEKINDIVFFKELRKQMACLSFPESVVYKRHGDVHGYTGLMTINQQ